MQTKELWHNGIIILVIFTVAILILQKYYAFLKIR